jgi:hypothetical protein
MKEGTNPKNKTKIGALCENCGFYLAKQSQFPFHSLKNRYNRRLMGI